MKRFTLSFLMVALAILCATTGAFAQGPFGAGDLGMLSARDYQFNFTSTNSVSAGAGTFIIKGGGYATTPGGRRFFPLATNAPITVDAGTAVAETVTPSAVTQNTGGGQDSFLVTATFTYAHGSGAKITSGTFGLCEARNDIPSTGTVVLKSGWGGTSTTITSSTLGGACDSTSVSVLDASGGAFQFYVSSGGVYTKASAPVTATAFTSAYGAGTAYVLTNTAAAVDFGTTDPAIVIAAAGTYRICAQINLAYNGATVAAETATIKVRRTNNTAADVSVVPVLDLPVATTLTHTYGIFAIPCFSYTTTNTDDALSIFANVSATLGAGSIDATAIGTAIVAQRVF